MNENLNKWERLKRAFEGFEPDVSGNWEAMKARLDEMNVGGHNSAEHFIRRAKVAERFALGATAVAVGLAFLFLGRLNRIPPCRVQEAMNQMMPCAHRRI